MRIWSISLIIYDVWCIHLSRSLYLYLFNTGFLTACKALFKLQIQNSARLFLYKTCLELKGKNGSTEGYPKLQNSENVKHLAKVGLTNQNMCKPHELVQRLID